VDDSVCTFVRLLFTLCTEIVRHFYGEWLRSRNAGKNIDAQIREIELVGLSNWKEELIKMILKERMDYFFFMFVESRSELIDISLSF